MKKGLFVYSNFNFSVKNAGVTRMKHYAQAIANESTAVYLVSCSSTPIEKNTFKEIYNNVYVLENNTMTTGFVSTLKFIRNLNRFAQNTTDRPVFLFYPYPLVYLEVVAIIYLKLIKKRKVFYELNEIRKHTSNFHERISVLSPIYSLKKMIYKMTFSALEGLLSLYNGLICISTAIENYGAKYNKNTIRIPILTNPKQLKLRSHNVYKRENSFNIGFSGSIHPTKENFIEFFKVLGMLKSEEIEFTLNLCGFIKENHHNLLFKNLARKYNIQSHINFYGQLDATELSTFLNQQELLVIPRGFTKQNNYGFSTKLSDYLDSGKLILVTDVSDNRLFIKDGINGFIVSPDDNNAMLDKLKYIIENYSNIHQTIEKNARITSLEHFYYRNFSQSLSEFLFSR